MFLPHLESAVILDALPGLIQANPQIVDLGIRMVFAL
jgi:hypothetical protein